MFVIYFYFAIYTYMYLSQSLISEGCRGKPEVLMDKSKMPFISPFLYKLHLREIKQTMRRNYTF